jgi:predicted glycosyltransferase
MHFALFTISSGDTMARESCLAGTPVIYTGGRYMSVNADLIRKGIFFEPDKDTSVMNLVDRVIGQNIKEKTQGVVRRALLQEWDDTTEVIISSILSFMPRDQLRAAH